jgi:hypothetical protein
MKPPKLLPWIARKAGITDELALKLWRRAAGETEERVGNAKSSEYFGLAVEHFLNLVEDEAKREDESTAPKLGWLWRYQKRMALHSLTASQSAYRWWENLRRRSQGQSSTAH